MFFLNFFLAYKIVVDKNNYKSAYEKSFVMPVFMLIYSPYCPHCTAIHPTWEKLMDKYQKDKKVLIGDCNDISYRTECDALYKTDSFPTFVTITRGRSKRLHPERNLESFINETEKLKKIDFSTNCSTFQSEFSDQYPAFILTNNKSKEDKCKQLNEIAKEFPQSSNYLYMNETNSNEESFVAMMTKEIVGVFENANQSLFDFIKEYYYSPFGHWNYSEAMETNRRIGLFIHNNHNEFLLFQPKIVQFFVNFTLCKIDSNKFLSLIQNIKLNRNSFPAFAVSNIEKTKFYIIKNIFKDKNSDMINDAAEGKFDNQAEYDLSVIFPIQKVGPKREKIVNIAKPKINGSDVKTDDKKIVDKNVGFAHTLKSHEKPLKLASGNFKIVLCVLIISSILTIIGIALFIRDNVDKIE